MFGAEGAEYPGVQDGPSLPKAVSSLFLPLSVPLVRLEQAAVPPEPTCLWQHRSGEARSRLAEGHRRRRRERKRSGLDGASLPVPWGRVGAEAP